MAATVHLAIRPKSDLTLLYGIAHELQKRGFVDSEFVEHHTEGFDAFSLHVKEYDRARVLRETGVDAAAWDRAIDLIALSPATSFWWTMGVNQSHQGTRTAQAIINLALQTGNIGRPGTGANSITGQCNAMGSRLFSNTTNLMGGRKFENAGHRSEVSSILNIPVERIPNQKSWAYDQIVAGIDRGDIRGLWIIGTNPAHSWIHQRDMHRILAKLEFCVVQDMYSSAETGAFANLVLPAAGWGEKDGTFINSERRIGVIKKVKKAPEKPWPTF